MYGIKKPNMVTSQTNYEPLDMSQQLQEDNFLYTPEMLFVSFESPIPTIKKEDITFDQNSFDEANLSIEGGEANIATKLPDLLLIRQKQTKIFQETLKEDICQAAVALPRATKYVEVVSTNSDFHKGAKRVVFLKCYTSFHAYLGTVVYKPHNLYAERIVFGNDNSIFEELGLATFGIQNFGSFGIEEIVEERDLSQIIKRKAYNNKALLDLGKIILADEVLGLGDLHLENIILGEAGVTIIDGEFVFLPPAMTLDGNSTLGDMSSTIKLIHGNFDSYTIGGLHRNLELLGYPNSQLLPYEDFKCICQGYKENINRFDRIAFDKIYRFVSEVRFSVISTGVLGKALEFFWSDSQKIGNQYDFVAMFDKVERNNSLRQVHIDSICDSLIMSGYCHSKDELDQDAIKKAMIHSFSMGSIPRFTFSPNLAKVYIDDIVIIPHSTFDVKTVKAKYYHNIKRIKGLSDVDIEKHLIKKYQIGYKQDSQQAFTIRNQLQKIVKKIPDIDAVVKTILIMLLIYLLWHL